MMTAAVWRFEAIGTAWRIETAEPLADAVVVAVEARIAQYDRAYSRFREDSLVAELARDGGTVEFPDDAPPLFAMYDRLAALTDGAVTPLVGRNLVGLGYDATYTLRPTASPQAAPAASVLRVEGRRVTLTEPALLDVGAAGKGQLVDLVAAVLRREGVVGATIDASGDIRHDGEHPLRVALEHPYDAESAIGVAELSGTRRAIAASATNRRTWGEGLHHIVDGRTGVPVRSVVATWALAASALEADALATALFFVPGSAIERQFDADWVRMFTTGRVEYSSGLPGEVFTR
jgi:FAD:protein FMN transferase